MSKQPDAATALDLAVARRSMRITRCYCSCCVATLVWQPTSERPGEERPFLDRCCDAVRSRA